MYNPMTPAPTPVSAWVRAARRLKADGDQHGLMLHIEDPNTDLDSAGIATLRSTNPLEKQDAAGAT